MASVDPIVIYRSVNREGATFALKSGSRERIKERFGDAVHLRARLFISHETQADYQALRADLASQVVQLLTGLSAERLSELGGVVYRDPETEREIPSMGSAA